MKIKIGDRVRACIGLGGAGLPRLGVVTGVMTGPALSPSPQFLVRFDGSRGHSGPCLYVVPA